MHEAYLARCILEKTLGSLPPANAPGSVIRVTVRIGRLDAVVPHSLLTMFDAQKAEFDLPAAQLCILEEDVRITCRACGEISTLDTPDFICLHCGSRSTSIVSGKGIILTELTLSDD